MINTFKNNFIFNETRDLIRYYYPDMNPKSCRERKKPIHIRITQNANLEKIISLFGSYTLKEHNTLYSSSYYTLYFNIKGLEIPFILSIGELKVNKNDKIVTKQLTPSKIGIFGKFYNQDLLISSIFNLISSYESNLLNTLQSLCKKAKDPNFIIPQDDFNFYKKNYASINKDFGEILTAIYIFNDTDIEYIEFPELNNQPLFDILVKYNDGIKEHINIKSEKGSGQSFKTIPYKYIEEALNNNFFDTGSYYEKFVKMIAIFHKKLTGKEKHIEVFKIFSNGNDFLSCIINDIKSTFYIDDFITLKNINLSVKEYNNIIKNLFLKYNITAIGLPKEKNNNEKINLNNLIIFTLSTIISKYHDQKIFNKTINKILTNNIINISISINNKNNSFNIEKNKNPEYKIHYWANSTQPTNNLIGYKII